MLKIQMLELQTTMALAIFLMQILSPLFLGKLKKYKPIKVQNVANAMAIIAQKNYPKKIFESDQLQEIGKS